MDGTLLVTDPPCYYHEYMIPYSFLLVQQYNFINPLHNIHLLNKLGNIGFDPLQLGKLLCQDNDAKKVVVQSVEIFNGRVAMLATVGRCVALARALLLPCP